VCRRVDDGGQVCVCVVWTVWLAVVVGQRGVIYKWNRVLNFK
jgi:hypothetical protein